MTPLDAPPRGDRAPLSPQTRRRRRRQYVQWAFMGLAVLLTIAFFFVMIVVVPAISNQVPTAGPDQVSSDNTTQFTDAGIDYAVTTGAITFNLSDLPLTAEEVGMGPNATAIVDAEGLTMVTMYLGEGDPGHWRGMSEAFVIETVGGEVAYCEFAQARTF